MSVIQERAIVSRFNGQERIELSLGLLSESVETGLVFPTPAPADVTSGAVGTFDQIEEAINQTEIEDDWWGSNAELSGGLDPIQFSFDSDQLVYPMELSRAATAEQRVRLYVFEDHRMQVQTLAGAAVGYANSGTRWAGAAPEALDGYGEYLTVLDLSFQKPAVDIPGDLALARASSDAEVKPLQQTRIVRFLGMPAGWALVLVFGIEVLVLIFVVPIVRSRRSAS